MTALDLSQVLPPDLDQGASSAALQECVTKLDEFQAQARLQLFKSLASESSKAGVSSGGAVSDEMHAQLDAALAVLCENASYLLPETPEAQLLEYANHYRALTSQVAATTSQLSQLQVAADLELQIQEFYSLIQQGLYGDAAWTIVRLRKTLQGVSPPQQQIGSEGGVRVGAVSDAELQDMMDKCLACESHLTQLLDASVKEALHVDAPQHTMVVRRMLASGIKTTELWPALEALNQLTTVFANIAEQILHQVLELVFAGQCGKIVEQATEEGQAAVLRWTPLRQPPTGSFNHKPEKCCQLALKLVAEHLFVFDESLLRQWGEVLWPQLCDSYVRLHAAPFVRAKLDDAAACSAMLEAARGLEEFAMSLDIVDEPHLVPAVEALSQQALDDRQRHYLEEARSLLVGQTYEVMPAGHNILIDSEHYKRVMAGQLQPWQLDDPPCGYSTSGPIMPSGKYTISKAGFSLVKLVEQLLEDASVAGTPSTACALVRAVSKVALMARHLPIALDHQRRRLQVPQIALLHFNDLNHLANALLILPACYAPELVPSLEGCSRVLEEGGDEAAPPEHRAEVSHGPVGCSLSQLTEDALMLREAARRFMAEQISAQSFALQEIITGLDRLRRVGSGQTGIAYRRTVLQVLHSLARLGRVLLENLTPEHVVQLGAGVLASVCNELASYILDRRDISIDDTQDLKDILSPIADEALPTLLGMPTTPGATPSTPDLSGVPIQVVSDAILARCIALRKLRALLMMLDAGLKEILEWWESGGLKVDGLDKDAVLHMLKALFEDSSHRRAAIAKIQQSDW